MLPGGDGGCSSSTPGCPGYIPICYYCHPSSPPSSGYVSVSPDVYLPQGDPRIAGMRAAWNAYMASHKWGGRMEQGNEVAIWYLLCDVNTGGNTGLCGSGFSNQIASMAAAHSGENFNPFAKVGAGALFGGTFFLGGGSSDPAIVRSLADPQSMVGATLNQLRAMVPKDWIEETLPKGVGVKFLSPGRTPGGKGWVEFNEGAPGVGDPLHAGPYMRLSVGGLQYRAALEGNAVLNDPAIPNVQIMGSGSTGVYDLSPEYSFDPSTGDLMGALGE